ncbi:hypothetical protein D9M71_440830 [compost metagenome]
MFDQAEDVRRHDVTTDDRQVRRGIFRFWFLDHVAHAVQVVTNQVACNHAVLAGFLRVHFHDRDDGAAILLVQLDHLLQYAVTFQVDAQVIRQHHGERLVADQRATGQDRMTQAFHFCLASVGERALIQQATDADQVFFLVGALDLVFQLVADVEVVFQGALAATGDDGDFVQAGIQCLFDAVLDQWLVHHRQHFFGHGFSRWQEASTVTGCWEQAFLDHISPCKAVRVRVSAQSNQAASTLQCPALANRCQHREIILPIVPCGSAQAIAQPLMHSRDWRKCTAFYRPEPVTIRPSPPVACVCRYHGAIEPDNEANRCRKQKASTDS